jgi:hypothetical protein
MAPEPEHIAISKRKGIEIDWKDGTHRSYSNAELRDHCPCAHCTGAHGTEPQRTSYSKPAADPFPMFKPAMPWTTWNRWALTPFASSGTMAIPAAFTAGSIFMPFPPSEAELC